jgi:hypothetical protein
MSLLFVCLLFSLLFIILLNDSILPNFRFYRKYKGGPWAKFEYNGSFVWKSAAEFDFHTWLEHADLIKVEEYD